MGLQGCALLTEWANILKRTMEGIIVFSKLGFGGQAEASLPPPRPHSLSLSADKASVLLAERLRSPAVRELGGDFSIDQNGHCNLASRARLGLHSCEARFLNGGLLRLTLLRWHHGCLSWFNAQEACHWRREEGLEEEERVKILTFLWLSLHNLSCLAAGLCGKMNERSSFGKLKCSVLQFSLWGCLNLLTTFP